MKKNHDLLMSVIGIGKVMSRELVYLFSAKNFSTAKQAAAYVGLIPKLNESGSFKGRTTLSKIGPSRIRSKIFYQQLVLEHITQILKHKKIDFWPQGKQKCKR
jgi:transposase